MLFILIGHHLVFHLQQAAIKVEMRKMIRSSLSKAERETFSFSLNDQAALSKLEWEGGHEFRLNGKMYDVIEKRRENGELSICCISDDKETLLLNRLIDDWKENDRSNKIPGQLFQLLQTLFHENNSNEITLQIANAYCSLFALDKLPLQIKKILTPPPQFSQFHLAPIAKGAV